MSFAGEKFRGRASSGEVELPVWDYAIRAERQLDMSWLQAVALHSRMFDYMANMLNSVGLSPKDLADLAEVELLPEVLVQGSG